MVMITATMTNGLRSQSLTRLDHALAHETLVPAPAAAAAAPIIAALVAPVFCTAACSATWVAAVSNGSDDMGCDCAGGKGGERAAAAKSMLGAFTRALDMMFIVCF